MRLKHCVELLPNPGESETRPACIEALWSDGDESQTLAYLSYFTRPKACAFISPATFPGFPHNNHCHLFLPLESSEEDVQSGSISK